MTKKFNEILSDAGVELAPEKLGAITEAFHKIGIIDQRPKYAEQLSEHVFLSVERLIEDNPGLKPFVTEICDAFVDKATQDSTRTILNSRFEKLKLDHQKGHKAPSEDKDVNNLDIVIKNLEELQEEVSTKIGPKNSKEFADRISKIKEDYNSKSGEEQTKTLYDNLESLKEWSTDKAKETADKSTWQKIGTVISSCLSLVKAKIIGKTQEVNDLKNNLGQATKELKNEGKKEVITGLEGINSKAAENQKLTKTNEGKKGATTWVQKINNKAAEHQEITR